jgi:hypothetical protein
MTGVALLLLVARPALAQTFPPPNPNMGPIGTSTMHANSSSSGVTAYCGPGAGAVNFVQRNLEAVFPSILMSSDGLLVCVATKWSDQSPTVYLLDPDSLDTLAEMNLPGSSTSDLAGGIYSYLDNEDRLVLVNADGDLLRIAHNQKKNGAWQLTVAESIPIGYPDVVGIVPDYTGNVWFATADGTTSGGGSVIGYHSPTTGDTEAFTLPAGEMIANSISSSPTGVAIASTAAIYLFVATDDGVSQVWRQTYDRGPARKPGQLSWGTGSTPSFFGPLTGFEYLTITDNASPQEHMLVYRASDGSLIGSMPFLTADVNSGSENATLAIGSSLFLTSTYGYPYPPGAATGPSVPRTAPFAGGMQRVDVAPDGDRLTIAWQNESIASAALPRMSSRDGLIYTVVRDVASGMYSFVAIDASSGVVVSSTDLGSGDGDNTLQMVGTLGPTGVLYQGRYRGLFSVTAASSSACTATCIDADFVADGIIGGSDVGFLLSRWGPAEDTEVADLDVASGRAFVRTCGVLLILLSQQTRQLLHSTQFL